MAQRTSHRDSGCTLARPLDVIGDGWSLLIVRDAFGGLSRFGEFQQSLGVAKNILAARLRALVEHGVLDRVSADKGARAAYVLTDKGRALFPVLAALRQWGDEHCFAPEEQRTRLVDRESGLPPLPIELRASDGRALTARDVAGPGG